MSDGIPTISALPIPSGATLNDERPLGWSTETISRQYFGIKGQVCVSYAGRRTAVFTDGIFARSSLTGAAEAHKGEAVENEATNFVNGIASVAVATSIGKAPERDSDQSSKRTKFDNAIPDPTESILAGGEAKHKASGAMPTEHHNKAKDPVIDSIWKGMRPALRGIEDLCDNYERLGKYASSAHVHYENSAHDRLIWCSVYSALAPCPPYPEHGPRLRLAAVLLPVMLITVLVKAQYLARGATFFMGVAFFSQPYMTKGWRWFTTKYPHWPELLMIQKFGPILNT